MVAYFGIYLLLKRLADEDYFLDSKDEDSRSPLSYAAEYRHLAVVQLLLERGAEADCKNKNGRIHCTMQLEMVI
jgi:ankyrin repeat protein